MKIKFQADADIHRPIITGLLRREPLIDFRTAEAAGLKGLDDLIVLGIAADQDRVLVSHDVTTMPIHFANFITTRTSPGVVLVPQSLTYHQAIEGLLRLWTTAEPEKWVNVLFYLPR